MPERICCVPKLLLLKNAVTAEGETIKFEKSAAAIAKCEPSRDTAAKRRCLRAEQKVSAEGAKRLRRMSYTNKGH